MPLVVTGTVGIDTIHAPTGSAENVLGGSCTYFAAAASFYTPVRIVAAVGDDFPRSSLAALSSFANIDASGLEVRRGSKTFRWGGRYHENMDKRDTLYTELGVVAEAPPPIPDSYRDSRYIFLANTHPAVQLQMLEAFPQRRLAVADTMDLWINTARADLDRLLSRIDGLVLNYDEAEMLTGKRNPVSAARHILERGPTFVVVKKGEHGSLIIHNEGIGALPAYPAETVVDPTGAGDCFAGGLMGYIAEQNAKVHPGPGGGNGARRGVSLEAILRACAHGTVIASFNIESFSLSRLASLTREQLDARYAQYAGMLRIH